ncbi:MAG: sigma-70 family RNA polymerase sigma factor [Chitinophagaceae bacterium]
MDSNNKMDDDVLIGLLGKNKDEALELIYRRDWKELYVYIFSFTHNKNLTEDIIQETFLQLWKYKDSIQINDSIVGYLKTSAKNNYLRWVRQNQKRPIVEQNEMQDNAIETSEENIYMKNLAYREMQMRINKTIRKMPEQMQNVFVLRKERGLSYKQISKIMDIAEGTVKKQLYYAMKLLKRYI